MKLHFTKNSTVIALVFAVLAGGSNVINAKMLSADLNAVRVVFSDLNLTNSADQATLYERLHAAARAVCVKEPAMHAQDVTLEARCIDKAVNGAIEQVGNPGLKNLHASR
jgi:UrcA family protein